MIASSGAETSFRRPPRPRPAVRGVLRLLALALLCGPAALGAEVPAASGDDPDTALRAAMVEQQLVARGIADQRVLEAMRAVPRHRFVGEGHAARAYEDQPLPIGHGQTISQPYIVALMTELLEPRPGHRVLEVGTGSGYQAAVLSPLVAEVYTIEIVEPLARRAAAVLEELGCDNVTVRSGDGYAGWPEHAPFDSIIVTAAPERVPDALLDQLRLGGRMVIPVGPMHAVQELRLIEKAADGSITDTMVAPVRFVPMTGGAGLGR